MAEVDPRDVEVVPIDATTWDVFEEFFGPDGVDGGCWCAYFKMTPKQFHTSGSRGHKAFMRRCVDNGEPIGLVARAHGEPWAWVAVSPRSCNARLERSVVARVEPDRDLTTTWSVTCFYGRRRARRRGMSRLLLDGAVAYAIRGDARVIEGYPVDTGLGTLAADERYHGRLDTFLAAGFELIERRGKRRALVRLTL